MFTILNDEHISTVSNCARAALKGQLLTCRSKEIPHPSLKDDTPFQMGPHGTPIITLMLRVAI